MTSMASPRLQLRWSACDHPEFCWQCHYELMLPLNERDVRRDIYGDNGEIVGQRTELVVPIKEPSMRDSRQTPCVDHNGVLFFDTPYRDGCHADWDAALLGGLPVYVISLDGVPLQKPAQQEVK